MSYTRAIAKRRRALAECRAARGDLDGAVDDLIGVYQAHPVPALVGAAGVGFVLAQLRVGTGLVRTGMSIATGPAWRLVRQYLGDPF
ncbi:MAG TPA: hypothetical protein VFP92_07645 [Rhodanobacteraceae bacterium]|nr:hypothetical protein [Rhodanobacteraceae bacterium]